MTLNLTCLTCGSDSTQRLSIMRGQQSFTGLAGQTALAAALREPKKPHAFLVGFAIGSIVYLVLLTIPGMRDSLWPAGLFLIIWMGIGAWYRSRYDRDLAHWQQYLEQHFICMRCGAIFSPSGAASHAS